MSLAASARTIAYVTENIQFFLRGWICKWGFLILSISVFAFHTAWCAPDHRLKSEYCRMLIMLCRTEPAIIFFGCKPWCRYIVLNMCDIVRLNRHQDCISPSRLLRLPTLYLLQSCQQLLQIRHQAHCGDHHDTSPQAASGGHWNNGIIDCPCMMKKMTTSTEAIWRNVL